jgi:hypothetical protein
MAEPGFLVLADARGGLDASWCEEPPRELTVEREPQFFAEE